MNIHVERLVDFKKQCKLWWSEKAGEKIFGSFLASNIGQSHLPLCKDVKWRKIHSA